MTKTNQAFIGEQCTRNDDGVVLIVSNKLKKWPAKVIMRSFWTQSFNGIRKVCEADPVGGVHRLTGRDMIREQAPGPSVLVPVMVEAEMNMITDLMNQIIVESCI